MSGESDIEIQTVLPKKKAKKPPKSPTQDMLSKNQENRKPSTKEMITQALSEMKSRKGISLYAIKKYIEEKYRVDVEKFNYLIKKSLKDGVEGGSIVQTKGMGASGSFRLAAKAKLEKKTTVKKSENISRQKPTKAKKKTKENKDKKSDNKTDKLKNKMEMKMNDKKKMEKNETGKDGKPKKVTKIAKGLHQTPSKKKAAMMKRKSIGTIIKPPRMKPKAR